MQRMLWSSRSERTNKDTCKSCFSCFHPHFITILLGFDRSFFRFQPRSERQNAQLPTSKFQRLRIASCGSSSSHLRALCLSFICTLRQIFEFFLGNPAAPQDDCLTLGPRCCAMSRSHVPMLLLQQLSGIPKAAAAVECGSPPQSHARCEQSSSSS